MVRHFSSISRSCSLTTEFGKLLGALFARSRLRPILDRFAHGHKTPFQAEGHNIPQWRRVPKLVTAIGRAFYPSSLGKLTTHLAPSHSSAAVRLAARAAFVIAD